MYKEKYFLSCITLAFLSLLKPKSLNYLNNSNGHPNFLSATCRLNFSFIVMLNNKEWYNTFLRLSLPTELYKEFTNNSSFSMLVLQILVEL